MKIGKYLYKFKKYLRLVDAAKENLSALKLHSPYMKLNSIPTLIIVIKMGRMLPVFICN